jgi:hypothetical protein
MNCRLFKPRPYRTPIIREDPFSVGGLLNLELLKSEVSPRQKESEMIL